MALVVETGAGLDAADAYISLIEFQDYADDHGFDLTDYTDPQQEQAIRRATTWFDAAIALRFRGFPRTHTQGLILPQSGLLDRNGYTVPHDSIHNRIKWAVAEAAWRELQTPYSLMPDVTTGEIKKRARVGPIEVEYAGLVTPQSRALVAQVIEGIIAPILPRTLAGALYGRAVR